MRLPRILLLCLDFGKLDRSIDRIGEIRDSYLSANVSIYGKELAEMLNDWR